MAKKKKLIIPACNKKKTDLHTKGHKTGNNEAVSNCHLMHRLRSFLSNFKIGDLSVTGIVLCTFALNSIVVYC